MYMLLLTLAYVIIGIATAVFLHDKLKLKDSYCVLGGLIWPFVASRCRIGSIAAFRGFTKELDEAIRGNRDN